MGQQLSVTGVFDDGEFDAFSIDTGSGNLTTAEADGVWLDPNRSGTGLQFDDDNRSPLLTGAFYLYDEAGEGMWVTLLGPRPNAANPSVGVQLLQFSGPPLGTPYNPAAVQSTVVGTGTITQTGNGQAVFDYTINGVAAQMQLQPFAPGVDGPLAGVWYDPNFNGKGLVFTHQDNQVSGAWYFYDELGEGTWATFVGELDADETLQAQLLGFNGPSLNQPYAAELVQSRVIGQVSLAVDDSGVRFDYTVQGVPGSLSLQPFQLQ